MVAIVIATISFQNVVNPPGDVRPGQYENFSNEYVLFLKLNRLCLISFLTGLSLANRFLSNILSLGMYGMLSSLFDLHCCSKYGHTLSYLGFNRNHIL